ncbi:hypothetical protein [Collimonas pratensis]|nr:hypothetical protein [Collimonas pratensis]
MDRYAGKPFLRLLECFILDAIGQLDDKQRTTLHLMEPKLHAVYGTSGTWLQIVSKQMEFPESLPEQIQGIWKGYLSQAKIQGIAVDPNEFVITFVNENFPNIVA